MVTRQTPIMESSLRGLHPESIDDATKIKQILDRAAADKVPLYRGLSADIDLERATLDLVTATSLILQTSNFDERANNGQIFLRFDLENRPYFFATRRIALSGRGELVVEFPRTLFYRERRDRSRRKPDSSSGDSRRVQVAGLDESSFEAEVLDHSPSGMAVLVPGTVSPRKNSTLTVRYLDGANRGREGKYEIRSSTLASRPLGWRRVGLSRAGSISQRLIEVDYRSDFEADDLCGMEPAVSISSESVVQEPNVKQLRVPGLHGNLEELVYLIDGWGEPAGSTAVLISTGWGQTKEAALPLARTLVSTFRAHQLPIEVVRFDGIRRRGESFIDPEFRIPGREAEGYVFSQGVRDIGAMARHLRNSPEHCASRIILISFSASAIEARKAVAQDRGKLIDGWISVVGSPDLQSMARSISGGVDFVGGHERGLKFGVQELLGVRVDIDKIAVDAARHELSFIEDSRRDLERIQIPISWFHGQFDAWVDIHRVRDVLSHGSLDKRRLIVFPTGHQLKSSRQADFAFRLVSREVGIVALGRNLEPVSPPTRVVRRLRLAEQRRLPDCQPDLRSFWRDYLIGRDQSIGIELLTAGSPYRAMMARQIDALDLVPGCSIADLGCGTGSFALALARRVSAPASLKIIACDYVSEALQRARLRLAALSGGVKVLVSPIVSNLDLVKGDQRIPLADCSVDRVIASLFISYLEMPNLVMNEIYRILRPGGRVVLSSLCRDADISRLYVECLSELQAGGSFEDLPELRAANLGDVARNFLNDAARILELEDVGAFKFMDPEDLSRLAAIAGFEDIRVERSLGHPAQAVVMSARRPNVQAMGRN